MKTYADLHDRYTEQALWTRPFREYIFRKLSKEKAVSILEVGCGTGAVLKCISEEYPGKIHCLAGIDKDGEALNLAKRNKKVNIIQNIGESLCFPDDCFDLVCCHYMLMWTKDPIEIVSEMRRVTKKGGICTAFAEPDYSNMSVYPLELKILAEKQKKSFEQKGASTEIGRDLENIFHKAGFHNVSYGSFLENKMEPGFLKTEIDQMKSDLDLEDLTIKIDRETAYSVKTYYAYSEKSKED